MCYQLYWSNCKGYFRIWFLFSPFVKKVPIHDYDKHVTKRNKIIENKGSDGWL